MFRHCRSQISPSGQNNFGELLWDVVKNLTYLTLQNYGKVISLIMRTFLVYITIGFSLIAPLLQVVKAQAILDKEIT